MSRSDSETLALDVAAGVAVAASLVHVALVVLVATYCGALAAGLRGFEGALPPVPRR